MPKQVPTSGVEVTVPVEQLEAIRTSLFELFQVCADALDHDATRHLRVADSLTAVHARRAELATLDAMLEQIGWPGEPSADGPVTLSAAAPRLREVVWVALARAATELEEACGGYWHGESDLEELRRRLAAVRERLAMLAHVEDAS
jgi:hypothetical protein